jgi:hypothetical protein
MKVYGVLTSKGVHEDVSMSLAGAKRFATLNGYDKVTCRYEYNAKVLFEKFNGKWVELKYIQEV